jgi:hypothetical protein
MPFMDFLNQLARSWNEGANQGLETDWATKKALEQKTKELETLFPIKLRQKQAELEQGEPFTLRKIAAQHLPKETGPKLVPKGTMGTLDPKGTYTPFPTTGGTEPGPFDAWYKSMGIPKPGVEQFTYDPTGMKDEPIAPEGVLNAARKVAGVTPGQRMQIGVGAQGQPMWHVADEPTPAGELSGLTRKRAIELATKGVPWPTAMAQAMEESNTAAADGG